MALFLKYSKRIALSFLAALLLFTSVSCAGILPEVSDFTTGENRRVPHGQPAHFVAYRACLAGKTEFYRVREEPNTSSLPG
jgi:hypothetical protein